MYGDTYGQHEGFLPLLKHQRLIMTNVFTITSNCCGEPQLMGVFANAKAALTRLEHMLEFADPHDEYRLEYTPVKTAKQEKESLTNCRRTRLERLAAQESAEKAEV